MDSKAPYFDGTQVCAQMDPEIFFPINPSVTKGNKRIVKSICGSCHFETECLEYALTNDVTGIWANTSDNDRRIIRKKRRLPAPPTVSSLISNLVS